MHRPSMHKSFTLTSIHKLDYKIICIIDLHYNVQNMDLIFALYIQVSTDYLLSMNGFITSE